ncbi:MAG TPA: hypothetical protein VFU15_00485, partial [Bacteroidia bacterium]|nr:hypothetical protein [Bacteroidia bacterium]
HFRNVYSTLFHGIEPYHYFEMWLAAFFMDLSGGMISHLQCLRMCAYGFILAMCAAGMIAICETIHGKVKLLHVAVSLLFLFFIPNIAQLFFNYDHHFSYPLECNPVNRINFRTYWMFLMPSFIFFLRKEYLAGVIALLLLPVISITTAPAVFGTIALLVVVNARSRFFDRKQLWLICGAVLVMVLCFGLLFSLFKIKGIKALYSFSPAYILAYFKGSWKAVLYTVFMEAVNVLVVASPFILVLLLLNRGKENLKRFAGGNRFILSFLFLALVAGVLFFQATSFMNNAYQFVFIAYCVLALTIFILIQKTCADILSASAGTTVQLLLILFLVFSGIRLAGISRHSLFSGQELYKKEFKPYSRDYLSQVSERMKLIGKAPGGYIGDSSYYAELYYSKRLPDFYFPGLSYFIFAGTDDSYQFCLSDTAAITFGYRGTPRDLNFLRQAVASSLFQMDFYSAPSPLSIGEKRRQAIKKYNIAYMILCPGVDPDPEWAGMAREKITDKVTGETFVTLR